MPRSNELLNRVPFLKIEVENQNEIKQDYSLVSSPSSPYFSSNNLKVERNTSTQRKDVHKFRQEFRKLIKLVVEGIVYPVFVCMLTTMILVILLSPSSIKNAVEIEKTNVAQSSFFFFWLHKLSKHISKVNEAGGSKQNLLFFMNFLSWSSSAIAAIMFIFMVAVASCIIALLVYYNCNKLIAAYMISSASFAFFFMGGDIIWLLWCKIDTFLHFEYVTLFLICWNLSWVGILSLFLLKTPNSKKQFFLCLLSILSAFSITIFFSSTTTFSILVLLALWDIISVNVSFGPLHYILERSQYNEESPMPIFAYNAVLSEQNISESFTSSKVDSPNSTQDLSVYTLQENTPNTDKNTLVLPNNLNPEESIIMPSENIEMESNKRSEFISTESWLRNYMELSYSQITLGLGDFIYYSTLVSRSALWSIECGYGSIVAVLCGLAATIALAPFTKQSVVPALPISIALGIFTTFSVFYILMPEAEVFSKIGILV